MTPPTPSTEVPHVEQRDEHPTIGLVRSVPMSGLAEVAHLFPEVVAWVQANAAPAGPPFFRYHLIDMASELRVEVGMPLIRPVPPAGDLQAGTLPAGRYAVALHHGPPASLQDATSRLLAWADEQGLAWDATDTAAGEAWGCRLENYLSDPTELEPDDWTTELAFRLAD